MLKRLLILIYLLLLSLPADATIAFVAAAQNTGAVAVTSSTIGPSVVSGHTVVVVVGTSGGTVSGITSTPSQTWTFRVGLTNGATRSEIWTSPLSSVAVTSIVVNYGSATDAGAISLEYSGVAAFGVTSTSTTLTVTLTTQDSGNFIVGALTDDSNTITTTTGNQRATIAPFNAANEAGSDNTVSSPGSVSVVWSATGTVTMVATALELRSTTGGAPAAVRSNPRQKHRKPRIG